MPSYLVSVRPPKSYGSELKVYVDGFHEIQYLNYIHDRKTLNNLFKLLNSDFEKLEKKYNIPPGTINSDARALNMMSMRARYQLGDVLLFHTGETKMDADGFERLINTYDGEELEEFIKSAKVIV